MTAARVNAILDIGIALALGVIGGAVAALAMRGCESKACQIVGDCAEPPTVRKPISDTPGGLRFEERDSGRGEDGASRLSALGKETPTSTALVTTSRCTYSVLANPAGRYPPFFAAIRAVESAGDDLAVGDGGRSSGPYQIGRAYWQDGGGKDYDRLVWNRAESERVMLGYFMRYEPEALARGDFETLARLHNGGPNWRQKLAATDGYWAKVKVAEAEGPEHGRRRSGR